MGWKPVVWMCCLVPVLTGCGALRHRATGSADRVVLTSETARPQTRPAPPAQANAGASGSEVAPADRGAAERSVPPLPKPELPVIKAFNPTLPSEAGVKFGPGTAPPDPDLLPAPNPPLAVAAPGAPEPTSSITVPTVLDTLPPIPFRLPPAPPK